MVSKTSSVRSIRLPNTTWEWLARQAAVEDITLNALIVSMLDPGKLLPPIAPPSQRDVVDSFAQGIAGPSLEEIDAHAEDQQRGLAVPLMERKPFNPQPKKGKAK